MIFSFGRTEHRKPIKGYGDRYEVGDLGNVYSGGCQLSLIQGKYVKLCWKGQVDRVDVGYLVARAFLPNPEGRPYLVYKDGDPRNIRVENLSWSEKKQKHAGGRHIEGGRRVVQYFPDGRVIGYYGSLREASDRTGIARQLIKRCCDGEGKTAKGYIWRYE